MTDAGNVVAQDFDPRQQTAWALGLVPQLRATRELLVTALPADGSPRMLDAALIAKVTADENVTMFATTLSVLSLKCANEDMATYLGHTAPA